jgi:hypothetical protein
MLNDFRDNVPTILLAAWPLNATLFEGETTAGPVSLLFSEDPDSSKEAIESNPIKAHSDLMRAAKCFFMAETVKLQDALAIVKKPR